MNRPSSSATQRSRSWLWLLGGLLLLGIISVFVVALLASLLILPYFQAEKSVTLIINGQPQIAVTNTNTIAELLNEVAIHLSEGDTVAPALTSRVTDNLTIEVARARSVTVTIDGHSQVYRTHLENPAQILESMGMMVGRNDKISIDGTQVQADLLGNWPVPATEISLRRTLTLQLVDEGRQQQIETTNDQLINISQIEHSRHRSVNNFFVNLVAGPIAYCRRPYKPSVQLDPKEYRSLVALI